MVNGGKMQLKIHIRY